MLEALLALAVVAIIGAVAVPAVQSAIRAAQFDFIVGEVVSEIRLARSRAVAEGKERVILFFPDRIEVWVDDLKEREVVPSYGARIEGVDFAGESALTFHVDGSPSAGGEFILSWRGMHKKVLVLPVSGLVRVEDGN
mgnify:CR=1 FL=1